MLSASELLCQEEGLRRPIEQRCYISQRECNASRRCVLINWMSEVAVSHEMHRETFHLAVSLLDRFLEQNDVPKQKLQLYGVACLLIAGKLKVFIRLMFRKFTLRKYQIIAPSVIGNILRKNFVMPNLTSFL